MTFELEERYWGVPDQEFIDDVIAVSKKLNKNTVTMQEYLEYGIYHSATLRLRFGSWLAVLEKAGLKSSRGTAKIDEALLFKNLEDLWAKLGRQPRICDMKNPELQSQYSHNTYITRFGTWMKGLRKFVEYQNSKPRKAWPKIILKEHSRRKNKIINGTTRHITIALRFSVFVRDGFTCIACGRSPIMDKGVKLHCDHIKPWSKGGETVVDNLQTLCEDCNLGKGCKLVKG